MIWDSILFRKQHSGFTKAFSALVGDRNPYVVINKEILPPYLGYLLQGNAFRNNVSLMRNSWKSGKPLVLFPSSKRWVPTCASMFWDLDKPQDGNVHTVCVPHKEKKRSKGLKPEMTCRNTGTFSQKGKQNCLTSRFHVQENVSHCPIVRWGRAGELLCPTFLNYMYTVVFFTPFFLWVKTLSITLHPVGYAWLPGSSGECLPLDMMS